jgi:hypothetical protein
MRTLHISPSPESKLLTRLPEDSLPAKYCTNEKLLDCAAELGKAGLWACPFMPNGDVCPDFATPAALEPDPDLLTTFLD